MIRFTLLVCLVFTLGIPLGHAEDFILAEVNGELLTLEYLTMAFSDRHQGHTGMIASEDLLKGFLMNMIEERLLIQEAYSLEIDREVVKSPPFINFRKKTLKEDLYKEEILEKAVVSEEEVKEAYGRLNVIFHGYRITLHSQEKANGIYEQLRSGENFEELAIKNSKDDTAKYGGDMGFVAWGRIEEEIERVLFSMEEGEISKPFETKKGWVILTLKEKKESEPPEFDRVSDNLERIIEDRKLDGLKEQFYKDLYARFQVSIKDELIEKERFLQAASGEKAKDFEGQNVAQFNGGAVTFGEFRKNIRINKISEHSSYMAGKKLREHLENMIDNALLDLLVEKRASRVEAKNQIEYFKEKLMMESLYEQYLLKNVKTTEEEVEDHYQENKEDFEIQEAVKLRIIASRSREKLESAYKKIEKGEGFAAVAAEVSEDRMTASKGGDAGWVRRGQLPAMMDQEIFSLKVGEITKILEAAGIYRIFKIEERKEAFIPALDAVRDRIEMKLLRSRAGQERERWVSKLKEYAEIKVFDDRVKKAAEDLQAQFEKRIEKVEMPRKEKSSEEE